MSVPPASAIAGPAPSGSEITGSGSNGTGSMASGSDGPWPDGVGPSGAELVAGLAHSHDRANANTAEIHRANATVGALAALLVERGVIAQGDLEQRQRAIVQSLRQEYLGRGMGVVLQETETSKYDVEEAPKIDCASRLPLCRGACCRLSFALTAEDVEEGIVRWDLRRPYVVAHGADGRCVHQEAGTCRCSIYAQRPATCRTYDCRRDRRIWLDFERRIPNPGLDDPKWPASLPAQSGPVAHQANEKPQHRAAPKIDPSSSWTPVESVACHPQRDPAGRPIAARARRAINRLFDRVVRARLEVLGRSTSAFQVCGYSGLVSAVLLGVFLTVIQDLSLGVLGVLVASSCATFLALAMGTKIVTGEEKLIYYHHEVGILIVGGVVLRLLDQPVLPYLELTLLAVGMFLALGRVGCLMVGCCHGRPCSWGVRYGPGHADDGFPSHLTGIRLFPIQLLESATVLVVVVWGTVLITRGHPPGEALVLYVMGYGAARFVFEFARGDADRSYLAGFSEAQWTSLLLMAVALAAGLQGSLPLHAWHLASAGLVAVCVVAVACRRWLASVPTHQILHARHLDEIARVLRALRAPQRVAAVRSSPTRNPPEALPNEDTGDVLIGTTSQGFRLSVGASESGTGLLSHYGLSRRGDVLSSPVARVLGSLILQLEHPGESGQLVSRRPGLFHLLVRSLGAEQERRS
jgi:hypothetical protein